MNPYEIPLLFARVAASSMIVAVAVLSVLGETSSTARLFDMIGQPKFVSGAFWLSAALIILDTLICAASKKYRRRSVLSGLVYVLSGALLLAFSGSLALYFHVVTPLAMIYSYGGCVLSSFGLSLLYSARGH